MFVNDLNKNTTNRYGRAVRTVRPDAPHFVGIVHKSCHLFLTLALLFSSSGLAASSSKTPAVSPSLLDAIRQVESGGRCVTGDSGRGVGVYQIHKIYVDDVNRILKRKAYTYDDRNDEAKSREMVRIYLTHYARVKKLSDPIEISRLNNGGPNGHKKTSTLKYADKIRKAMK